MSEKHTKGPWIVRDHGYPLQIVAGVLENGDPEICRIGGSGFCPESDEENRANARLIAAAPDGYALSEHILSMADDAYLAGHPEWLEIVAEAKAFKNKANGGNL